MRFSDYLIETAEVIDIKQRLHQKMDAEFDKRDQFIDSAQSRIDDVVDSTINALAAQLKNPEEAKQIVVDYLSEIVMYFDQGMDQNDE